MSSRVFHIISHLELGGGERVAANIAKNGSNAFEYHIVAVTRANDAFHDSFVKELEDSNVIVHEGPKVCNKLGIIVFPFWFFTIFIKWRPNVIHTHSEVPDLSVFLFYLLAGHFFKSTKYVRTIHNTELWNRWNWIGRIVEVVFQSKNANVAICQSVRESYFERYSERPPIFYNGLEKKVQLVFPGIDSGKINILFAGRFEWQKGVDEMLEVFSHYADDSRFLFHVVGSGSKKDEISRSLGNQRNVRIYDSIYSIATYLGSFDYLFMPSNHEGLPLLSIESALAGTPVIINNCAGLNETVPEDWPLAVHDNNLYQYFRIFDTINEIDRDELGQHAYAYANEKFSITKMVEEYERLYRS